MYVINKHDEKKKRRESFGDFLDRCVDSFVSHADQLAERKLADKRAKQRQQWAESKRRSRARRAETKSDLNTKMSINFLLN